MRVAARWGTAPVSLRRTRQIFFFFQRLSAAATQGTLSCSRKSEKTLRMKLSVCLSRCRCPPLLEIFTTLSCGNAFDAAAKSVVLLELRNSNFLTVRVVVAMRVLLHARG